MSEVNNTVAEGEMVQALGKTWCLSHVGPGTRSAFSAGLKLRARLELAAQKADLDEDTYSDAVANLNEALASGHYNWGPPVNPRGMGRAVAASLKTEEGKVRLLQLLLAKQHGDVAGEQVLALVESAGEEEVGRALLACLGLQVAPKNAQAPGAAPGAPKAEAGPTTTSSPCSSGSPSPG